MTHNVIMTWADAKLCVEREGVVEAMKKFEITRIERKYIWKYVPDPNGDAFVRKYLKAKSNFTDDHYYLEIDYDLCAPFETWTLTRFYKSFTNGIGKDESHKSVVYNGKELTENQINIMVDLVLESEHLTFE